jgi:hypothetical protein
VKYIIRKKEQILCDFFQKMKKLAHSSSWPETKEECLADAVNHTDMLLHELDNSYPPEPEPEYEGEWTENEEN